MLTFPAPGTHGAPHDDHAPAASTGVFLHAAAEADRLAAAEVACTERRWHLCSVRNRLLSLVLTTTPAKAVEVAGHGDLNCLRRIRLPLPGPHSPARQRRPPAHH